MKRTLLFAAVLLLGACVSAPGNRHAQELFRDAWFQPPGAPIDGAAVFALSLPMRHYLHFDIARQLHAEGPRVGLINALQATGQLKLEYDSSFTRNAVEAFEARTGNCLSLVILTAAMAGELGLEVQFQEVLGERTMSRNGDLVFYNGHVNVVLSEPRIEAGMVSVGGSATVIDFLPGKELRSQRVRTISEQTVSAMYMNNRAAEALASGDVDGAYWWARAAIQREPHYTATYNTLGLVYRRHGHIQEAAAILAHALALEPANTVAMSNVIPILRALGRAAEAERWASRLKELQPYPPFHFFDQGQAAMQHGDFASASRLFAREIDGAAYYHEFHYWLALAYVGLHEPRLARKHFMIATDNATTRADAARYQAALDAQGSAASERSAIGNVR